MAVPDPIGTIPNPLYSAERLHTRRHLNDPGHSLSHRLANVPWLMDFLLWELPTGGFVSYLHWTPGQRRRLDDLFNMLDQNQGKLDIQYPKWGKANWLAGYPVPRDSTPTFTAELAFDLYAAHVAHILLVEAKELVPWTIGMMSDLQLAELFTSDRYHSRILPSTRTHPPGYYPTDIQPGRDYQLTPWAAAGTALLGDPRTGFRFMRGETSTLGTNLIGATTEQTLVNLTLWAANNVFHNVQESQQNDEFRSTHSQILDRLRGTSSPTSEKPIISAPMGCHSSANLLRDLARSVNIPLVCTNNTIPPDLPTHGALVFIEDGSSGAFNRLRILPHADNICAEFVAPIFPVDSSGQTLTDGQKAQAFFDVTWARPQVLTGWGFMVPATYVFDETKRLPNQDTATNGIPGGYWKNLDSMLAFYFEKNMKLGSWQNFLSLRCNDLSGGSNRLQGNWDLYHNAQSSSFQAYAAAADACINAYGNCGRLQKQFDNWLKRPTNVLRE